MRQETIDKAIRVRSLIKDGAVLTEALKNCREGIYRRVCGRLPEN